MSPSRGLLQPLTAALALTVGVFLACWYLGLPSFTIRDSALFALVASDGGIAHPPGSPTWCAMAWAFVNLLGFDDPARGTNLFCGLLGAITCGGLYLLAWRLLPSMDPSVGPRHRLLASLVAPLILMQGPGWWMQCLSTEQYTLMTALLVALGHVVLTARARQGLGWWVLAGSLWGLAVGNHLSQICLVIPLALACWDGPLPTVKRLALVGVGFLLGISIYTWVPVRSGLDPLVDTGNIDHFRDLPWLVGRVQFDRRSAFEAPAGFAWEWLKSYAFLRELGVAGIVLAP